MLLCISGCGLTNPDDGSVIVYGTVIGVIPDNVEGLRIFVRYPNPDYTSRDISEALLWTDQSFRQSHHARGDSTTIKSTFTLRPNEYLISIQQVLPPEYSGGDWRYYGFGYGGLTSVEVLSGKTLVINLRGSFE